MSSWVGAHLPPHTFIEEEDSSGEAASQSHSGKWQLRGLKLSPCIWEVVGFPWSENLGLFAAQQPSNLGQGWVTSGYISPNPIKAT